MYSEAQNTFPARGDHMTSKLMRTKQASSLRDAPGLHGAGIEGALIGANQTILIDPAIDDGYVLIVGPNPPIREDGTYLGYGKKAWIEYAHLEEINIDKSVFRVEVDWANKTIRFI